MIKERKIAAMLAVVGGLSLAATPTTSMARCFAAPAKTYKAKKQKATACAASCATCAASCSAGCAAACAASCGACAATCAASCSASCGACAAACAPS